MYVCNYVTGMKVAEKWGDPVLFVAVEYVLHTYDYSEILLFLTCVYIYLQYIHRFI